MDAMRECGVSITGVSGGWLPEGILGFSRSQAAGNLHGHSALRRLRGHSLALGSVAGRGFPRAPGLSRNSRGCRRHRSLAQRDKPSGHFALRRRGKTDSVQDQSPAHDPLARPAGTPDRILSPYELTTDGTLLPTDLRLGLQGMFRYMADAARRISKNAAPAAPIRWPWRPTTFGWNARI